MTPVVYRRSRSEGTLLSIRSCGWLIAAASLMLSAGALPSQGAARLERAAGATTPEKVATPTLTPTSRDPEFPNANVNPGSGFFGPLRPKLIVLVHGQAARRDAVCGHLTYARKEWGFKFVRGLLGAGAGDLYTFSNVRLNEQTWPEGAYYVPPLGQNIARVAVDDNNINDHCISTTATRRDLSVMLTYRDGSQSLAAQASELVNQIFRMYNQTFSGDQEPQIALVGHSMGGLASRYLLSNPFPVTTKEHFRANFLRNRALYVVTLATPHEGSRLADWTREIADFLQSNPPLLQKFYEATGLTSARQFWLTTLTVVNDPSTQDLKTSSMFQMNQGVMAPHRAIRADGTGIPIYALCGRSPGGGYLNSSTLQTLSFRNDVRRTYEVLGCVGFDLGVKSSPGNGWGPPPSGSDNLDWVQRISLRQIVDQRVAAVERSLHPCLRAIVDRLGGLSMVGALVSFDASFPVYLDRRWETYLAEVQVPFKHWACGEFRVPWADCQSLDLECLKRFLLNLGYNLEQLASCLNPANWQLRETVSIPCVKVRPVANTRGADGEIDDDGLVSLDSGLGLRLGTSTLEYFDHTKSWLVRSG
ncbi:MAG: hypothetical protein FJ280_17750, partial [Planctomycetes bacterium]|nr:hypothetical protein [Planctomycetota bacterium]